MILEFFQWFFRSRSVRTSTRRFKSTFVSKSELLEARMLLAADVLQNPINAFDVNNDGATTPLDALVLNMLSSRRGSLASGEPIQTVSVQPVPPQIDAVGGLVFSSANAKDEYFYDVNGDGLASESDLSALVAQLNGAGEPGDVVTFHLRTTDLAGNQISTIDVGDEFILSVLVQDTQDVEPEDGFGVFAAYLDVEYNSALATVLGDLEFGSSFGNGQSGDVSAPGLFDEVGAFTSSFTPLGNGELELFSIRMRAEAPGGLTFASNRADVPIANEVVVFGSIDPVSADDILYGSTTLEIQGSQDQQTDLVAFAQALADEGVELWTTTINARDRVAEQLDLFKEGQHFLPINELLEQVESEEGEITLEPTQAATDAGRSAHNIWIFPDGSESTGELLTLEEISSRSGVPIPTSVDPWIVPLEDVTVLNGAPLHIALDGYDPNGDVLTYTITVENEDALEATILEGNRSIRFTNAEDGTYLGDTVFELFEGRAPRATDRMIELALDGFYDDITYHRVINDFVIQGGDPTGVGNGGSDLDDYDDQFHVDLQHTSAGILSMAKTDDDTNDSQFFVTERATRNLDFNHTIFGLLTEGDRVRETMSNVSTGDGDRPVLPLVIEGAQVFEDTQNAVVMLKALQGTGSTTVTVTATDVNGNSTTETFEVTLEEDTENGTPFLEDFESPVFEVDEPIEFSVNAVDVEGDTINYRAFIDNSVQQDAVIEIDENGNVTASGFVGTLDALIQVSSSTGFANSLTDGQFFEITAKTDGPTGIDLVAETDTGVLDDDNVTNLTELQFEVSGVIDGAPIVVFANDVEIGRGTATGETSIVTVTTTVIGQQDITAAIDLGDELSSRSPRLPIDVDQTPPAAISNVAPTTASVGDAYTFDAEHENERSVGYSLENAPEGMTINELTGELSWSPTGSQAGTQSFQIIVSDVAGNTSSTDVTVEVAAGTLEVSLNAVTADGVSIAGLAPGTAFNLEVFVEDQRANPTGVQELSFDLIVDPARASVDASTGVAISDNFAIDQESGTISATGVADFGGSTDSPAGDSRVLVATIPMIAGSPGILNASIVSDLIVFGDNTSLPASEAEFIGATLSVVATGDEFTAVDDEFTIREDSGPHVFEVLENDILAADSRIVSIDALTNPTAGGVAEITDNGRTITYSPGTDVNGLERFQYRIEDGEGNTSTARVSVQITSVIDPPRAIDRNFPADLPESRRPAAILALVEDGGSEVAFPLLGDEIPDGQAIEFVAARSTTGASLRLIESPLPGLGNTEIGYIPAPNVSGEDTFTYTIREVDVQNPQSDTGTMTVRIARVNDAPDASSDSFLVTPGQAFTIQADELLDNDSAGPLEGGQTIRIVEVAGGDQGSVVLNEDGTITYTPSATASGRDQFTYTIVDDGITEDIVDGELIARDDFLQDTTTVQLVFTEVATNDPPVAANDSRTVVNDGDVVSIDVLRNDSDDGGSDGLTITEVTQGSNGSVAIADGRLEYTPDAEFFGSDTFSYTISDGRFTDDAVVTVQLLDPTETTNSQFRGVVFQDIDGNGIQTGGEPGYASVIVRLTGTDAEGNAVDRETSTDVNGNYTFDSLSHGTYQISQEQPLLLLDGAESASEESSVVADDTLSLEISDGVIVSENNTFAEVGVSPRFMMLELLSSRRNAEGFLVAMGDSGRSQFVGSTKGWEGFTSIRLETSADGSEVTIIAVDENSQEQRATVSVTDRNFVQQIGRDPDTGTTLLRITRAASAFEFVATS